MSSAEIREANSLARIADQPRQSEASVATIPGKKARQALSRRHSAPANAGCAVRSKRFRAQPAPRFAERQSISLLQAEWGRLSEPARIQRLSQAGSGADDAPAIELSSLTLLPRKGETSPMEDAQLRSANVIVPASPGSGD